MVIQPYVKAFIKKWSLKRGEGIMEDLSKKQVDMFVRAIMPDLYKAQERWDAWNEALDKIAAESVKLEDLEKQDEALSKESE